MEMFSTPIREEEQKEPPSSASASPGMAADPSPTPKTPTMERGGVSEDKPQGTSGTRTQDDPDPMDPFDEPAWDSHEELFRTMKYRASMIADDDDRVKAYEMLENMQIMYHVMLNVLRLGRYPILSKYDNPLILKKLDEANIQDIFSLVTLQEEDFKSIGVTKSTFALVRKLQALNFWYIQFSKTEEYTNDYDAFMSMSAKKLSRFMVTGWKPAEYAETKMPTRFIKASLKTGSDSSDESSDDDIEELDVSKMEKTHVSAGVGSSRAKLAEARRSSIMSAPKTGKKSRSRVTFAAAASGSGGTATPTTPSASSGNTNPGSGGNTNPPAQSPAQTQNQGQPPVQPPVQPPNPGQQPPNPGQGQPPMQPQIPLMNPTVYGLTQQPMGWLNQTYVPSRASDFDKGSRRSVQDYTTFSNKEQWSKWSRQLIGQAYDHKCENILDATFVPDPNDADAVALFDSQQRFMFSVFSKALTEPKAQDILRKYTNPKSADFGDAQSIYADLVDYYEGGAQGRVSVTQLEVKLTVLRLNKTWTKSISAFVTHVSGLIQTHKDLTDNKHDDNYYMEKLNATFEEHQGMRAHIKSLEAQEGVLLRRLGKAVKPKTYADQLHELGKYAITLDDLYSKRQNSHRNANQSERGGRGGRGNGGRGGRGRGNGGRYGGRGNGGRSNGRGNGRDRAGPAYVSPEEWACKTPEERQEILRRREQARSQQANMSETTQTNNSNAQQAQTSGPPTTINVQEQQPSNNAPGTMIRNMMSQSSQRSASASQRGANDELTIEGSVYRRVNVAYRISNMAHEPTTLGALVDGGANGGLLGADVRILEYVEGAHVDITGVGESELKGLKIAQAAAKVDTVADGPIIVIMSQYAELGFGKTIHSKGQLEHFGQIVDDTGRNAGGRQCIITAEGYTIPIAIRDGLPHVDMAIPTDAEMEQYPHVFLTSDAPWDPKILDNEYEEEFYDPEDPQVQDRRDNRDPRIDDHGFLRTQADYEILFRAQEDFISANRAQCTIHNDKEYFFDAHGSPGPLDWEMGITFPHEDDEPETRFVAMVRALAAMPNRVRRLFPHVDKLKPYFGWALAEKIKQMLDQTTQHYRGTINFPFRKHFKSRFPAANVKRLNKRVATDTFFSDTPARDDGIPGHGGCTMMQIFLGLTSGATYGYPMKAESEYPQTLEDHIRKVGAPNMIISDNAKAEIYGKAKELQRMYNIDGGTSEAYYQHQNPAERKMQDVKRTMNGVMDRNSTPKWWWLLAALFTLELFLVLPNADGLIPHTVVTGQPTDISKFMHFHFWQEVFVESHKEGQREELARWCYPARDVGDELTYWVLLTESERLVARSNVRPATDPLYPNLKLRPKTEPKQESHPARPTVETVDEDDTQELSGTSGENVQEGQDPKIYSKDEPTIYNLQDRYDVPIKLPRFSPEELVGLTFLYDTGDDQLVRATVSKKLLDRDAENHQRIKMIVTYDDGKIEEIISYNELCDIIADQHNKEASGEMDVYTFQEILDYQGPLKKNDPMYMGSSYNVKVLWTDGSITWEPLSVMMKSDPVTLAQFAKEHDMLDKPGWKNLKKIARRAKVLQRMVNANKRAQRYNTVVYKFGVRLPRNVQEAYDLDAKNGNTYWADAIKTELGQIIDYKVFRSVGKNAPAPQGYQQIPIRIVFDVKQSLKRKARMVARGDKTNPPRESVYSGVASMRSLRIVCFLAELNGLQLTGGDVGNAYLEAYTTEKVCFKAGKEFREFGLEGHMLVIEKALYGLRTSGARFHAKFADTLRQLGFVPTYADPDVWIRDAGNCYEYVVVYVDDKPLVVYTKGIG